MVVLIDTSDGGLVAFQPSLTDRIRARLMAARYDQDLARGVPPEQHVCLALRAQRLVRSDTRRWLARSLRRLLDEAARSSRLTPPMLSPECRRRLLAADEALTQVIVELQRPAPLSSRGLASLCVLLRDGSGPLYGRGSARDLRDRLGQVHCQLMPLSIW
jgi:hypothetical protein